MCRRIEKSYPNLDKTFLQDSFDFGKKLAGLPQVTLRGNKKLMNMMGNDFFDQLSAENRELMGAFSNQETIDRMMAFQKKYGGKKGDKKGKAKLWESEGRWIYFVFLKNVFFFCTATGLLDFEGSGEVAESQNVLFNLWIMEQFEFDQCKRECRDKKKW